MNTFQLSGNLVDILQQEIYPATIDVENGRIRRITRNGNKYPHYLLPGFTDAHVHIESSMLIPSEFARLAVVHGTVATVSDPHEIANVMGVKGVEFMLENARQVPFRFNFGAPSCVPATTFETAGAAVTVEDIETLLQRDDIKYLTEMMNFPGVLHKDPEVLAKIAAAKKAGKPVDGHAPGLRGDAARDYIAAGISTDHECFTLEEALDKLKYGMHILIREGSAAKNFEALVPLLHDHPAVRSVEAAGEALRVTLAGGTAAEVNRDLVLGGVDVTELRPGRRSLEDVFFELTADEPDAGVHDRKAATR